MKWLIFILLLLAVPLLLRLAVMHLGPSAPARSGIDSKGSGLLHPCPATPNCYALTLDVKTSKESILTEISTAITAENGKLVTINDNYLQATFQSKLMAFIDDFECLIVSTAAEPVQAENEGAAGSELQLHCRSASRIGRSDLGANKKRVNAVLARAGIQAA